MRAGFLARARQQARWKLNGFVIGVKRIWLTMMLAIGEIIHRLTLAPGFVASRVSTRRVLGMSVLVALVVTPSVLYLNERELHLGEKSAYRSLLISSASEAGFLRASLAELLSERDRFNGFLLDEGYTIHSGDDVTVKVVATGYSSSVRETDSTPFITASNTRTRDGILALSRDLLKRYTPGAPFDFGDRVHVPGLGEFVVEDSMNSRWNNRIDIWFPSRLEALRFGVHEVYLRTVDQDLTPPEELSESEPAVTVSGL